MPLVVQPVGAEDHDELIQDGLAIAWLNVQSLVRRGRRIIPKSVAYYAIQRLKSGRRSYGGSRTDVMSPGCQIDGKSRLVPLHGPIQGWYDELDQPTLRDHLEGHFPGPAAVACQKIDWETFLLRLSPPQRWVLAHTEMGLGTKAQALILGVSPSRIARIKRHIATIAKQFWGDSMLRDAVVVPERQVLLPVRPP